MRQTTRSVRFCRTAELVYSIDLYIQPPQGDGIDILYLQVHKKLTHEEVVEKALITIDDITKMWYNYRIPIDT